MDERIREDIIREEAYLIWKVRQKYRLPGTAEGDWVEAERKLRLQEAEDLLIPPSRLARYL